MPESPEDVIQQALEQMPDPGDGPEYHANLAFWRERIRAALSLLVADIDRLKGEKSDAEALLGELGAGGSAAGLVPAIHNLASMRDAAEAERDEHRGETHGYFVALGEVADKLATVEAERDEARRHVDVQIQHKDNYRDRLVKAEAERDEYQSECAVLTNELVKAEAERDEARADHARWMERCLDNKAEKELADCREALRPLVEACIEAFGADGDWDDDEDISTPGTGITFGMIRQARAALEGK